MKISNNKKLKSTIPIFLNEAIMLNDNLKNQSLVNIEEKMKISKPLAEKTKKIINDWNHDPEQQTRAGDAFIGDIYSGLQFNSLSTNDNEYANQNLRIISGLYGILKPNDGIYPYRLEFEYKLAPKPIKNLYDFWGNKLSKQISDNLTILNLTSAEYEKAIIPYLKNSIVISPVFKTYNKEKRNFVSVAVHSKIARGNMAAWVIKNRIKEPANLRNFSELGYIYDSKNSTDNRPVFLTKNFKGIGLSIRKNK